MSLRRCVQKPDKIYSGRLRFFERPICSNFGYKYVLVHVENPYDFMVKINDEITVEFETRLNTIFDEYIETVKSHEEGSLLRLDSLPYLGMPVIVRNKSGATNRKSFARAEILEIEGEQAHVFLVDLGGVLTISCNDLLPVSVDMMRIPKIGIPCRMAQILPESGNTWPSNMSCLEDFAGSSQLVTFVDYYKKSQRYEVYLEVDSVTVSMKYFHLGIAQPVSIQPFENEKSLIRDYKYPVMDYSQWIGLKVIVFAVKAFCDEGGKVKCVLQMQPEVFNKMQDMIATHIEEGEKKPPSRLVPGTCCLAKFEDGEYFRAVILKNEGHGKCWVDYVDYKETAVVLDEDLLELPPSLLSFAEGAVVCQITDFLSSRNVNFEKLEELVTNKDLYAVVDACDPTMFGNELLVSLFQPVDFTGPDKSFVDLFDIKERPPMIREYLQNITPMTESEVEAYMSPRLPNRNKIVPGALISVINNWDSIWIQLDEEADMAARISIELTNFYTNGGCDDESKDSFMKENVVGTYVAARQADEEGNIWYRAKVVEDKKDVLLILYIDYGNTGLVSKSDVYPLSNYFAKDYMMAFECSIKL